MKCPYTIHRHNVSQEKYEYDDEGKQILTTRIENSKAEMIDCEKENCGAWKDGKCCYNLNDN